MSKMYIDAPYLVFQPQDDQLDAPLELDPDELDTLRGLAVRYGEIASHPANAERRRAWAALNDLEPARPMLWMNEVCWNEMDVDGELRLRTRHEVPQRLESELRRVIYQWTHMQGDMVVSDVFPAPCILRNGGFGVGVEADVLETEEGREIASRRFHNQFATDEGLERLHPPEVAVDHARTEAFQAFYARVFEGILPVRTRGCTGFWFAPWDDIVGWMGAESVLMALLERPDFMHALMGRLVDCYLAGLELFRELGLVDRNDFNVRIGSGGYGYTRQARAGAPGAATLGPWGAATAQIFGTVSPEMHEEFGLAYERRWLEKWDLAYYGCCEPLHNKLGILASIPNLRKVSVSPWADVPACAEGMRGRWVMSLKPSPQVLAGHTFDPEAVRRELRNKLEAARGCNVEIILKDISTVRHEPQRLWTWVRVANEVIASL
jgi:hypothetical protein